MVCDAGGRITIWNTFMEQVSGLPAGDVLGKPAAEVLAFLCA